jgi:hypothetical protein
MVAPPTPHKKRVMIWQRSCRLIQKKKCDADISLTTRSKLNTPPWIILEKDTGHMVEFVH